MVKSYVTEWHLITKLFTMVFNLMIHSTSDYLNTEPIKVRYSDKFAIQMFAIQIPTVYLTIKQ